MHGPQILSISPPACAKLDQEPADKPGSVGSAQNMLFHTPPWQPFLWARSCPLGSLPPTRKLGRAGRRTRLTPGAALAYLVLLRMEVAAFHPSDPALLPVPKTRLCGPIRHVAVPGRYPASRSAEPGLSSAPVFRLQRLPGRLPGAILGQGGPCGASACVRDGAAQRTKGAKVPGIVVEGRLRALREPARIAEYRKRRQVGGRCQGGALA